MTQIGTVMTQTYSWVAPPIPVTLTGCRLPGVYMAAAGREVAACFQQPAQDGDGRAADVRVSDSDQAGRRPSCAA